MNSESQEVANRLRGLTARRAGLAVCLWGEPGIGKTHLAQALLRATPCFSLSVRAAQPLEQLVLSLPRPKHASAWLTQSAERLQRKEGLTGEQLVEVLAAQLTLGAPIVIHAEDLHECSPDQLHLWQHLAARVTRTRGAGLLLTSRTPPPEGVGAVRVAPLSRTESDFLLNSEVGAALPQEALGWIFERAAGNPLFTLEFFRFLARQGLLWNDAQRWRWRVPQERIMPTTVEALIQLAVRDALGPSATADVLEARSLLPAGCSEQLWLEVSGLSSKEFAAACEGLSRTGHLIDREVAHPLYRETVSAHLSPGRRQLFARRALNQIDLDPRVVALIGDAGLTAQQAFELLGQAADRFFSLGQSLMAARLSAQAVEYAPPDQQGQLALQAGARLYEFDLGETIRLVRAALARLPQHHELTAVLAYYLAEAGEVSEVGPLMERLSTTWRTSRMGTELQLRVWHCLDQYHDVVKLWRARPDIHQAVQARTVKAVAFSMAATGEHECADALTEQALKRDDLSALDRAALLEARGYSEFQRLHFAQADHFYSGAIRLFETHNLRHKAGSAYFNRANVRQFQGDSLAAAEDARTARTLAAEAGQARLYAHAQLILADALFEAGESGDAEELLLESRNSYAQVRLLYWQVEAEIMLAALHREGQAAYSAALAARHAQAALDCAHASGSVRYLSYAKSQMSLVESQFGDAQTALHWAQEAMAALDAGSDPLLAAAINRALGTALMALGQHTEALDHLQRAQDGLSQYDRHKVGLLLARLTNTPEDAHLHLTWFRERGLQHGVRLAQRLFPGLADKAAAPVQGSADPATQIQLEVLGPMRLTTHTGTVPVRGRKRQELLATLLEARIAGRAEVSRLRLTESLYPDQAEMRSGTLLADLVYQVRETLGAGVVSTTTDGYLLGSGVSSDAETFLAHGDTQLWRGAVFASLNLEGRSEAVREALCQALRAQIEALLTSQPAEAVRAAQLLLDTDPYDLKALKLSLRAWQAVGNHKGLNHAYAQARMQFSAVGEALPDRWEDFLAEGLPAAPDPTRAAP
ncbi:AAA family ATPase [Deinococcus oregonensis]|uniref:AAA family ATPase n=1 Tax=Deinococcus oregonensis TaxID=1805970 RepID=A0ABV6ATU8_9DEIO